MFQGRVPEKPEDGFLQTGDPAVDRARVPEKLRRDYGLDGRKSDAGLCGIGVEGIQEVFRRSNADLLERVKVTEPVQEIGFICLGFREAHHMGELCLFPVFQDAVPEDIRQAGGHFRVGAGGADAGAVAADEGRVHIDQLAEADIGQLGKRHGCIQTFSEGAAGGGFLRAFGARGLFFFSPEKPVRQTRHLLLRGSGKGLSCDLAENRQAVVTVCKKVNTADQLFCCRAAGNRDPRPAPQSAYICSVKAGIFRDLRTGSVQLYHQQVQSVGKHRHLLQIICVLIHLIPEEKEHQERGGERDRNCH